MYSLFGCSGWSWKVLTSYTSLPPTPPLLPASLVPTARLTAGAKKAGGKLGLGAKKLGEKVDDSLFEQPPAPEAPPTVSDPLVTAGSSSAGAGASKVPEAGGSKPAGSRFAYDTLTQVRC